MQHAQCPVGRSKIDSKKLKGPLQCIAAHRTTPTAKLTPKMYMSKARGIIHPTQRLQEPRRRAPLDDQRVPVHTGHQTQPNGSPYGLCDLPLVLGAQARVLGVLYPPRLGHVLGHDCEVLGAVSA